MDFAAPSSMPPWKPTGKQSDSAIEWCWQRGSLQPPGKVAAIDHGNMSGLSVEGLPFSHFLLDSLGHLLSASGHFSSAFVSWWLCMMDSR